MSSSDDWLSSSDCEADSNNNNNIKNKKKRGEGIKDVSNVGVTTSERGDEMNLKALNESDKIPESSSHVENDEKMVLLPKKSSFRLSRRSISSSSSSISEISSTSKDLSDDGDDECIASGNPAAEAQSRCDENCLDRSEAPTDNFKALPAASTQHRSSSLSSCASSSSSVSLESSTTTFLSSSSSKRSSISVSSSISTSSEEREIAPTVPPAITSIIGEILEDTEISQNCSELTIDTSGTNVNKIDDSKTKQAPNSSCDFEQADVRKSEDGKENLLNEQLTSNQNLADDSTNNDTLKLEDLHEKEISDQNELEYVPADATDEILDNSEVVDNSFKDNSESTDCQENQDMATRNYNNGYNLLRDSKDSLGSLTTKHLLLDYLHGSDIFNKSHLLAPKSLKTYVPPSLSKYNDTSSTSYSTNSGLLKDGYGASAKTVLSDNITVPPTSKYVKYADRIALKNASKNEKLNFSKSLDEQSLKTNGELAPVKSGSGPSEGVSTRSEGSNEIEVTKQSVIEDDEEGHLVYKEGSTISDRYQILRTVGEGTFGKVAECLDLREHIRVALKIIKNVDRYRESAKLEINVLQKIQEKDPKGENLCVLILDSFHYGGHVCISFPMLGLSVYDFLKDNSYQPYPMEQVQHISYQLCQAVKFLHEMKLTHTDLKPENILFVCSDYEIIPSNQMIKRKKKPDYKKVLNTEIRLIDFGSATFDHEHHSSVISTRHYRAPEVLLDIGWYQPCDIWSIGCIIFELYTGFTLFQTHEDKEHLAMMERILGSLPYRMTKRSKTGYFWHGRLEWDYHSLAGKYVRETCRPLYRYLMSDGDSDRHLFDLVERMLEYEPAQRLPLADVLNHPFFAKERKRNV